MNKSKIIKQKKNPFLEREELVLEIESDTMPTYEEIKKEIGKNVELVVIKKINTSFGKRIFLADIVIYDNAEAKEKIETIPKKVRKKIEADKKAEIEAARKAEEAAKKAEEEAKAAAEVPAEESKPEEKVE